MRTVVSRRLEIPVHLASLARRDYRLRVDSSRLRCRVLVFPTRGTLRAFWKAAFLSDPGPSVLGVTSTLAVEVSRPRNTHVDPVMEVDARYVSLTGLTVPDLTLEVVAHECGHAAHAYRWRVGLRKRWPDDNEEEQLCYPLGRLVSQLVRRLSRDHLLTLARG